MKNIAVKVLNSNSIADAERMMVATARLTQRGHKISTMQDFSELFEAPYNVSTVDRLSMLPHPTIQKFGIINVAIVGASRRFLSQITRHQNEVKFMSGSLQYSDYTDRAAFCVPYEIIEYDAKRNSTSLTDFYISSCMRDLREYEDLAKVVGKDAAGYKMPQGMRNVLVISATPYQFKHMISQRTCNRNTLETQYVLGLIWEQLSDLSSMFKHCGPDCSMHKCEELDMTCGKVFHKGITPTELLDTKFEYIRRTT